MLDPVTIPLQVTAEQAALLQAQADIQGKTISDVLSQPGQSVQNLVADALNQANWRLVGKGIYCQDLITEAQAEASRMVTSRAGVAAK